VQCLYNCTSVFFENRVGRFFVSHRTCCETVLVEQVAVVGKGFRIPRTASDAANSSGVSQPRSRVRFSTSESYGRSRRSSSRKESCPREEIFEKRPGPRGLLLFPPLSPRKPSASISRKGGEADVGKLTERALCVEHRVNPCARPLRSLARERGERGRGLFPSTSARRRRSGPNAVGTNRSPAWRGALRETTSL
jgi:hypothetical protein